MFTLYKPSPAQVASLLRQAQASSLSYSQEASAISTRNGLTNLRPPRGFAVDHTRSKIGVHAFAAAKAAMQKWQHFNLGWVRIANPTADSVPVPIIPGQIVAVEAHTLGLWSLNCNRILYVIDEDSPGKPRRFGYAYGTTSLHVESGEERFLIEQDPATGDLFYDLLAISRPAHWLARLGYPYTRSQQRRFARGTHAKMARDILAPPLKN